ncbi:unnamed protein product [Linum tenue]|uniref:Uncharacterized protein n=1 Tax=Linum tenue TaxID=586396 RepID=A0AAV0I9Z3_9ROSI|nr:unnamed protein product [Linum tenue]
MGGLRWSWVTSSPRKGLKGSCWRCMLLR